MSESMKFGPQWLLRNLSQDNSSAPTAATQHQIEEPTIATVPRYQLAEHRYGREELLALYCNVGPAPETLLNMPTLYVEKILPPLALIHMTEEETRMWNRGINSDAVLRHAGKIPPSVGNSTRGGRGGSVDRGRGRGRGGGGGSFYSRGISYEEAGDGIDIRGGPRLDRGDGPPNSGSGFSRNMRPFDRSQSSGERNWGERNGVDPPDWNGSSSSPRKEFGTGKSFMADNWRRHRQGSEDDDGWRGGAGNNRPSDKWNRGGGGSSWRDGEKEMGGDPDRSNRNWERNRGWDDTHNSTRRGFDEDRLPEWAVENPSECGGSFDASGAFHGNSDDEEVCRLNSGASDAPPPKEPRNRKSSGESGNNKQRKTLGVNNKSVVLSSKETTSDVRKPNDREDYPEQKSDRLTSSVIDESAEKNIPKQAMNSEIKTKVHVNVSTSPPPEPLLKLDESSVTVPTNSRTKNTRSQIGNRDANSTENVVSNTSPPSSKMQPSTNTSPPASKVQPTNAVINSVVSQVPQSARSHEIHLNHNKSEDDFQRMKEVAEEFVKLIDDEEPQNKPVSMYHLPSAPFSAADNWFYRDPQGEEQGPFTSTQMEEWYRLGYFDLSLLVRRSCDEMYTQLGELLKMYRRLPFSFGLPPEVPGMIPGTVPVGPSLPTNPLESDAVLMEQYRFRMMHQQLLLKQQQQAALEAALAKLTKTDKWNSLSPVEQQQCISQVVAQHGQLKPPDHYLHDVPAPVPAKDPLMQLISRLQQSKLASATSDTPSSTPASVPTSVPGTSLDPLQQLIQRMGGLQPQVTDPRIALPTVSAPTVTRPNLAMQHPTILHPSLPEDNDPNDMALDHMQMLLRQLNASKPQAESIWNTGNTAPPISNQRWFPQVGGPPPPPGQLPTGLWGDPRGKEMKTEEEILEEQRRAAEELRREEIRKQEEERKRKEKEELVARLKEEELRKEAERKLLEEQRKRIEEVKRKEEEKKKKEEEERKRREEEEEARKIEADHRRLKEEAARRKEEEKRKREEEKERKRKLEEEKRRQEELRQKEEEERRRQEEENARKRAEEESRLEQQRRQAEALRRLQEQQRAKPAPWNQQTAPQPSLAEIQRQERERKEREMKEFQQQMAMLQLSQLQQQQQQQSSPPETKNALQLSWANKKPVINKVKSLAEIQAEEHEQMLKQQERERAERAQQQKDTAMSAMSGIWSTAPQNLSWAQPASAWNTGANNSGGGTGFWDEVAAPVVKPNMPSNKNNSTKAGKGGSNNNNNPANAGKNVSASKARSKKEEAVVMKLFENSVQRTDEFTEWCSKTLTALQASVDIPTFVAFLRDIDSPFEVKDYVRMYLGDGKETQEFARQFLERRSKWRNMQRNSQVEDDMCVPAPAINPLNSDFTEVKGKGKKPKKNKMLPVDHRILGFSVTASEDRINVGDRDYGEGV